jgi:hypothetical protein
LSVNFCAYLFERFCAAAHQKKPRTQFCELYRHGAAQSRASTRQENRTSLQKVLLEHEAPPFQDCTNARGNGGNRMFFMELGTLCAGRS